MIVLYFVFFIILYWFCIRYFCNNLIIKPILILYIGGAICAIYLYYWGEAKEIYLSSVFYQITMITLFLCPILAFAKEYKVSIRPPNINKFKFLGWIFIVLGIFSLFYFIPTTIKAFSGDIAALRDAVAQGNPLVTQSISNTVAGTIANFYPAILLFYFYSICFLNNSRFFNSLLLLASTSYIFHVFSYVGRDGVLFWIFSYIYSYCLFRPYMSMIIRRRCKKIFKIIAVLACTGFMVISVGRFVMLGGGDDNMNPVVESIISYQGQIFHNYGEYYHNIPPSYSLKGIFSLFFPSSGETVIEKNKIFYAIYGFNSNVFKGFSISIYDAMGTPLSIIFALLYAFFLSIYFMGKNTSFSKLIILTLAYQIPFHCYYYFRLSNNVGNLYIMCMILLSVFFSFSIRVHKSHKTNSNNHFYIINKV